MEKNALMASKSDIKLTRRVLLKAAMFMPLATAFSILATRANAVAAKRKGLKTDMLYQDKPHNKDDCSNCVHFIPGKTPSAVGTCAVLAGAVLPHGWCVACVRKTGN